MNRFIVIDITGGCLNPEEHEIHAKYQDTDPDADYYDPLWPQPTGTASAGCLPCERNGKV